MRCVANAKHSRNRLMTNSDSMLDDVLSLHVPHQIPLSRTGHPRPHLQTFNYHFQTVRLDNKSSHMTFDKHVFEVGVGGKK